jgi:hypothetical protein
MKLLPTGNHLCQPERSRLAGGYNFTFALTVEEVRAAKAGVSAVWPQQGLKGVSDSLFTPHPVPFLWQVNFFRKWCLEEETWEREERRRKREENISPRCFISLHLIHCTVSQITSFFLFFLFSFP